MSSHSAPLVLSPTEAHEISKREPVTFLDATWFMPNTPRDAYKEFLSKRIPGANFLDLDAVASPHELGLKHMMPTGRVFADACERFGINPSSRVVIYDSHGVFSSPRALFMFRAFGHDRSSILNGGLPAWTQQDYSTENGTVLGIHKAEYPTPHLANESIRSYEQMVMNSSLDPAAPNTGVELVFDARSHGRYLGNDPEPRPGLPSGHIPNSFSLPFNLFLRKHTAAGGREYTTVLPTSDIEKALVEVLGPKQAKLVMDGRVSVITSCGSGMTASILWLGLKLLGVKRVSLYDESWTGYVMRPGSKIIRG